MNINLPQIKAVADNLRDMLGDDFDLETFADTLEGETDAMDFLDRLILSLADDEAIEAGCLDVMNRFRTRYSAAQTRQVAKRLAIGELLDAIGEKKIKRPSATVTRTSGRLSVNITDEKEIPSQLMVITTSPDRATIKRLLDAGNTIPGAELVRGPDSIMVRI
jgi:hypothetical protein